MLRHPWKAEEIVAALRDLPAEAQRLFLEVIQHPDYGLETPAQAVQVFFRDEPVGGLDRISGEWFLARAFVGERSGAVTADGGGFDLRIRLADRHAYWGKRGASAVAAFRETVEKMTGARLARDPV